MIAFASYFVMFEDVADASFLTAEEKEVTIQSLRADKTINEDLEPLKAKEIWSTFTSPQMVIMTPAFFANGEFVKVLVSEHRPTKLGIRSPQFLCIRYRLDPPWLGLLRYNRREIAWIHPWSLTTHDRPALRLCICCQRCVQHCFRSLQGAWFHHDVRWIVHDYWICHFHWYVIISFHSVTLSVAPVPGRSWRVNQAPMRIPPRLRPRELYA